jgi:hypothetical protein
MESDFVNKTENYINSDDYKILSYAYKEESVKPFPRVRFGRFLSTIKRFYFSDFEDSFSSSGEEPQS